MELVSVVTGCGKQPNIAFVGAGIAHPHDWKDTAPRLLDW